MVGENSRGRNAPPRRATLSATGPAAALAPTSAALNAGDSVLDVGCGTGDDVREIARLVGTKGRVVGIDPSEAMIAESKRRAEGSGQPVHFQCGDVLKIDSPDAS